MTYRSSGDPSVEHAILSEHNCSEVTKKRFSKDKFPFGGDSDNTTFYIYVYDFQPPLWIVISFSQHPKLDLLQFFITFSICFLALLLVAAVLWKIKQRYDRYRRRQRLFVEMEQMASRPFGSVLVELERIPETSTSTSTAATAAVASVTSQQQQQQQQHQVQNSASSVSVSSIPGVSTTPTGAGSPAALASASASAEDAVVSLAQPSSSSSSSSGVRKRKKRGYRPSPIALEPCEGNRAAVLSLIVRLPTGGKQYAPPGYTGIAVASSLVTLGQSPSGRKERGKHFFDRLDFLDWVGVGAFFSSDFRTKNITIELPFPYTHHKFWSRDTNLTNTLPLLFQATSGSPARRFRPRWRTQRVGRAGRGPTLSRQIFEPRNEAQSQRKERARREKNLGHKRAY